MKTASKALLMTVLVSFAMQLASCGAGEVQSAKLYRERRDYITANIRLEKAIKADPTNDEAWYLYVVNLYDLKQYEKIANVIDTAMLYSVTHHPDLQVVKHNTWAMLYMGGYGAFSANPDSKEAQQSAIGYLESARKLEPEQPLTYELLGNIYYVSGDTAKGLANYRTEIDQVSASYDQGVALGLMLKVSPEAVERAIGGAPARKFVTQMGQDSALVYVYPSKQAYVYFTKTTKPPYKWELYGWRIGVSEAEGQQPVSVSTMPYQVVANDYLMKGNMAFAKGDKKEMAAEYEKSIPLLMTLQQIDPTDEFASEKIPEVYSRLDRSDKARAEYERIIAEHPSRQMYINYGTLLMKMGEYQASVAALEKALALKPDDESALFDIAATYKNWAAADQKAGKKTEFKSELEKSTEYFEKLRAINKTEISVLENLAENYGILGKKDKMLGLVTEFEGLGKTEIANSSDYWEWLAKLYVQANRSADAEAAYKKADAIKQAHK